MLKLYVWKGEQIDPYVVVATEKIIKQIHVFGKTRSSYSKSSSPIRIKQKHSVIKNKIVSEGTSTKKRKFVEEEPRSDSKRRRK